MICEELGAPVAEAPIGIRVGDDGDNDVILRDTAGLQFLNKLLCAAWFSALEQRCFRSMRGRIDEPTLRSFGVVPETESGNS
jgi:hypothetical protein